MACFEWNIENSSCEMRWWMSSEVPLWTHLTGSVNNLAIVVDAVEFNWLGYGALYGGVVIFHEMVFDELKEKGWFSWTTMSWIVFVRVEWVLTDRSRAKDDYLSPLETIAHLWEDEKGYPCDVPVTNSMVGLSISSRDYNACLVRLFLPSPLMIMSDSPVLQPLHNPSLAAQVVLPKAPLGNLVNQAPGMGAKALLAKKIAKNTWVGSFCSSLLS